ncbi:hypothetical protein LCGC14_0533670 [marine sediment metagenome]|uniref:Uncharacterized protein n=1 Tax=marine sediment metagenome TaxID=412755 RepID=A0A0F9RZF5_9ZZZZ
MDKKPFLFLRLWPCRELFRDAQNKLYDLILIIRGQKNFYHARWLIFSLSAFKISPWTYLRRSNTDEAFALLLKSL